MITIDIYGSTASASAKLREAGRKARQQKAVIDQAAAVEILNAWMGVRAIYIWVFQRQSNSHPQIPRCPQHFLYKTQKFCIYIILT